MGKWQDSRNGMEVLCSYVRSLYGLRAAVLLLYESKTCFFDVDNFGPNGNEKILPTGVWAFDMKG